MHLIYITILIFFPFFANAFYDTSYYEKYDPNIKYISNSKHKNLFIQDGRLKADGIVYRLKSASDIKLDKKTLKKFDLESVVIKIDGNYYKAMPSFKKLNFIKRGKKGIFRYTLTKKLILVYIPYRDKIQVIGVISQGEFIKENTLKEYDLDVKKEIKKKILSKILNLLGCRKNCNIKSDKSGNNYFYKNNKLIGILENFGNQKILIQKSGNSKKHIANIIKYQDKILLEDIDGNILYESGFSKILKIRLDSLGYEILLKIR